MFYAAQALLLTQDVRRSKHSGVITAFNEHFIRSGELPRRFFLMLRDGFEDRAEGDYGLATISGEQARAEIAAVRSPRRIAIRISGVALTLLPGTPHSYRRASMGSRREAFRAG